MTKASKKEIAVAVVGNPNCGKSTLINAIAGSRLQVGNWPGVTVEKKEARITWQQQKIKFIDLPGIYSLSPYSQEEVVARDFLIANNCDCIINVIDATNIERSLYLTVQLLELGLPRLLVFNIYDEAQKKGVNIDLDIVTKLLEVDAVTAVATKKQGVDEILQAVTQLDLTKVPKNIQYNEDIEQILLRLTKNHQQQITTSGIPTKWLQLKIIEGDLDFAGGDKFKDIDIADDLTHLKECHDDDIQSYIAEERHAIASGIAKQVTKVAKIDNFNLTKNIDKVILHKFLALPIFLAVMWLIFKFTFDISAPFIDWTEYFFGSFLAKWSAIGLQSIQTPDWFISLVVDGIIGGVGFVLVFIPVIFAMMFFITFLEASGYMARAAFITDRIMRSMGLHGKSFVPLLIGFGCNVPAIYATRTLESTKDRIVTSLVIPFMSCGARLPVYILFTSVFFAQNAATMIWLLYVIGILVAAFVGIFLQKTIFRQESALFIMELPPYRLPTFKNLMIHTWEKGKHFLVKAGTYIFAVAIIVWFLLNLPWGVQDKKDSLLGQFGQTIAPIFKPLGFGNWQASSSLITGIVAKEIIISTMGEVYDKQGQDVAAPEATTSFTDDLSQVATGFVIAAKEAGLNVLTTLQITSISLQEDENNNSLRAAIRSKFTTLSAFVFMVFTLLYMPCVVTGIAMKQEFGTWKWFFVSTIIGLVVAWSISFLIFNIAILWP